MRLYRAYANAKCDRYGWQYLSEQVARFTLASTEEILEVQAQGATYPPTLSAKLISLFDLNLAGRNAETTVELQKGDFHLMIEVLPAAGGSASDVDDILTYGGVPIN